MKSFYVIVAAAALGLISNGVALAACESFDANIPIDGRHFEYSDINGNGKVDPGDMIVGRDMLYDKDGKEIGRLFATVAIDEIDDSGGATKFADTQIYALPNGGFFAFAEIDRGRIDVRELSAVRLKTTT